jgi:hypothetical protein
MSYKRVLPRDLFNEAKFLKCLGQLSLILLNYGDRWPELELVHETDEDDGFVIDQDSSSGDLYLVNLHLRNIDRAYNFYSVLNSKEPYPLYVIGGDGNECSVLNDDGKFSDEFLKEIENDTARQSEREEDE